MVLGGGGRQKLAIKLVSIKPFIVIRQMETLFILGHSFSGPTMLSSIISDNQTTSSGSTTIKDLSSWRLSILSIIMGV